MNYESIRFEDIKFCPKCESYKDLNACHYKNLQPLWAAENEAKGSKVA